MTARAHYAAELARCEAQYGPHHLCVTRCLVELAIGFDRAGNGASARPYYRRAWAQLATTEAPSHPIWLRLAAAFGYRNKGDGGSDRREARAGYRLLHDRYEALLGTLHPVVADTCRVLANLSAAVDDLDAARAWHELEIAIRFGAVGQPSALATVPREVAATTYCLHPIDREPMGGLSENEYLLLSACALLAAVLDRLGVPEPARALDRLGLKDPRERACHAVIAGDFLSQRRKAFAAAAVFYDHALSLMPANAADAVRLSIAAKLQVARSFMAHGVR